MSFDGFVTKGISKELCKLLVGGRIDKIHQPGKKDILLSVNNNKNKYQLFASIDSSHFGLFIIDEKIDNPKMPSALCMLLRKHIGGGKITDISQHNWERIVEISIECRDEMSYMVNKKLIVEIMGKHSNIVLVDENYKIIDALRRVSLDTNNVRQIFPSMTYEYPPMQDKLPPDAIKEENIVFNRFDDKAIMNNIAALSPVMALNLAESHNLISSIESHISDIERENLDIRVYFDDNDTPKDFHIFSLMPLSHMKSKAFDSISAAAWYFYQHRHFSNILRQKSSSLEKSIKSQLKKLLLKKQRLKEDLDKARSSHIYQVYGELITANLHSIDKSAENITLYNYYEDDYVQIPLDKKLSPVQNAQSYYKKYAKSKRALIEKNIQLQNTDMDIEYLSSSLEFLHLAEDEATISDIAFELQDANLISLGKNKLRERKSKGKRALLNYITPSGLTLYVGRNNKENDYITTKLSHKNDLWFHAKDIPGSHVLLALNGQIPSDEDILFACNAAAYHSKARLSENVPVDYTYIKHVKKPKGSKPGMVIFTDNKTVYASPSTFNQNHLGKEIL